VLQSRPGDTFSRLLRGQVRLYQNEGEDALSDFNSVLAGDPSNVTALSGRAAAYHAVGEDDLALADSEVVLKRGKPDPELRLLRANIFRGQGKHELVTKEAELLMQENPTADFALVAAGKILSAEGKRDRAMDAMKQALALHPSSYIYLNRSQVRAPTDHAGRFADIEEALKLEPDSADALEMKASLLKFEGKYSDAIAAYDAAIAATPGSTLSMRRGRAIALYKSGRTAEAEKDLAKIRQESTKPVDLNNLCWDMAVVGILLESAAEDCREAIKLRPDSSVYKDSLGFALLRLGKLDDALQAYNEAIQASNLAASYMGRAFVYLRKGDTAHAATDREEALKRDPDTEAWFVEYGLKFPGRQIQASK
jgi:tetratricopeptide (TPR) repeat protein